MKTLIEVEREVWGKVKDFATVHDLTIGRALNNLLVIALTREGYLLQKHEEAKNAAV